MSGLTVWDIRREWDREPVRRSMWSADQQRYLDERADSSEVFGLQGKVGLYAPSNVRDALHDYIAAGRREAWARYQHQQASVLEQQNPQLYNGQTREALKGLNDAMAETDGQRVALEQLLRNEVEAEPEVMGGRFMLGNGLLDANLLPDDAPTTAPPQPATPDPQPPTSPDG